MPLDGVFLSGLTRELNSLLAGARVDKIQMPEKDEAVLQLHGRNASGRLVLSANVNYPRLHMTETIKENPASPPMFCMLLRKHLGSAKLEAITQPGLERLVRLDFSATDDFGEPCQKSLVCELMGRYSNLILIGEDGRIIDCLKRVDILSSEKRQVLPGMIYRLPPAPDKSDFLALDAQTFAQLLACAPPDMQVDKWLLSSFFGLSPLLCRELVDRAAGDTHRLLSELDEGQRARLTEAVCALAFEAREGNLSPWSLFDERKRLMQDFACMEIRQYGELCSAKRQDSFSKLLEDFYTARDRQERIGKHASDMTRIVTVAHDRNIRKAAVQKQELLKTFGREIYKQKGDILSASMHLLSRGMKKIVLENFYDEQREIEILLDERLAPAQNIAKYYKEYSKLRTAESHLSAQIEAGEKEIAYLETVLDELARAESESDLRGIREELRVAGYLAKPAGKQKRQEQSAPPHEYKTSGGLRIFAGRSNLQNDQLTLKTASKRDIWLHIKHIPGAHVILETGGAEPAALDLHEAAIVAAFHSKANEGDPVEVDYAPVAHVKKPAGAKPGMVIYEGYRTARVVKSRDAVEKLRMN